MPDADVDHDELTERTGLTPAQRKLRARLAANIRWAREADRGAATEPARRARLVHYEDQVDPDRVLTPEQRRERAENLRRADMARLALQRSLASTRRTADA